jgi:hypothetical protein
MRPLQESDLLKPGKLPSLWHRRLNKVHRGVLPQIYGESRLILRANPPVWKKPGNRETAAKVEEYLFQSR